MPGLAEQLDQLVGVVDLAQQGFAAGELGGGRLVFPVAGQGEAEGASHGAHGGPHAHLGAGGEGLLE